VRGENKKETLGVCESAAVSGGYTRFHGRERRGEVKIAAREAERRGCGK
jgi:hypothetical protein